MAGEEPRASRFPEPRSSCCRRGSAELWTASGIPAYRSAGGRLLRARRIKAKGDLEHRHLVDRLDDSGLLAPTLRLAEIACDHYDGEPLDRDAIREDLESVRRERSERHLRLAGPST
jgi:hypothetical protein